jgi:hypothetical protein
MNKADAIKFYGNPTRLAAALDISPQAVYKWPSTVPMLRQHQLEKLTGGRLKVKKVKR